MLLEEVRHWPVRVISYATGSLRCGMTSSATRVAGITAIRKGIGITSSLLLLYWYYIEEEGPHEVGIGSSELSELGI